MRCAALGEDQTQSHMPQGTALPLTQQRLHVLSSQPEARGSSVRHHGSACDVLSSLLDSKISPNLGPFSKFEREKERDSEDV